MEVRCIGGERIVESSHLSFISHCHMPKTLPLAIVVSMLSLVACSIAGADSSSASLSASSDVTVTSSSAASTVSAARTIEVDVASFQFTPSVITAKKGEKVQLKLVGVSGIHGFAVPDLGMNESVAAGDTVMVDLPTDTAGTFQAFCNVPCGPGHSDMKATIVIQ